MTKVCRPTIRPPTEIVLSKTDGRYRQDKVSDPHQEHYINFMSKPAPTYCLGPDFYNKLIEFVARFQQEGYDLFSEEFAQLDEFIAAAHTDQSDRTDKGLRRTPKIKYLLEAVSFKIYDQLNRDRFNQAKRTVIVLPDCLNLHNPDCLKTDEKWGDQCQQCVDDCQKNQTLQPKNRSLEPPVLVRLWENTHYEI